MRFRSKILVGLSLLFVLCSLYYLDDYLSNKKEEKKQEFTKALFFKVDEVSRVSLKNSQGKFELVKPFKNANWRNPEQPSIQIDEERLSDFLRSLSLIPIQQELLGHNFTPNHSNQLAQFGLENPKTVVSITLQNGSSVYLSFGAGVEIGAVNDGKINPISTYAMSSTHTQIFVVNSSRISFLEDKNFLNFRSLRLGQFEGKRAKSIKIWYHSAFFTLLRNANQWEVQSSGSLPLDSALVEAYLLRLQGLTADSFVSKSDVQKAGLLSFDLGAPSAKIEILDENQKVLQNFVFGITKHGIYSPFPDGVLGKFALSQWPDLVPQMKSFVRASKLGVENKKSS